jgi:hypothetical protein
MEKYPGLHETLQIWFEEIQTKFPAAHVSCAGRGKIDQEVAFYRKASRAHFGESAHNFNCALDLFRLKDRAPLWEAEWFANVVGKNLEPTLKWYGASNAPFHELPHVEVSNWRQLVQEGRVHLVE